MSVTPEQEKAIEILYIRSPDNAPSFDEFRERFTYNNLMGCLMGNWCNMAIGIESDGYIHS